MHGKPSPADVGRIEDCLGSVESTLRSETGGSNVAKKTTDACGRRRGEGVPVGNETNWVSIGATDGIEVGVVVWSAVTVVFSVSGRLVDWERVFRRKGKQEARSRFRSRLIRL